MELLISCILILIAEVNFHKEAIDDMKGIVAEQDEWHRAAVYLRIAMYGAVAYAYIIMINPSYYLGYVALFVGAYPTLFDFLLNLRMRYNLFHSNPRYDMGWVTKILLLITGIFTYIGLSGLHITE